MFLKGASIYNVAVGGGGGSPKSRRKEQNQLISVRDKGGGGQIIRKFCGYHIWKPPKQKGGTRGGESLTIKRGTSGVSWGIQGNIHRAADGDPPLRDAHISCTV